MELEIEKFTQLGTFSVRIYHGGNHTSDMPIEMLKLYDVMLTAYQVLGIQKNDITEQN
jgi:hypothetical protein